ncbi:acyltransferase family protein [Thalassotalea fonticola]|uniref:Acyltransferase family protein n=1 Tax=Thalassotalea fonticola TaxID=3065649 RepID=A0ABZ0GL68_9GAMM|nr:acyltransferase family protein [Colwelliaceae bacterium S1-1]
MKYRSDIDGLRAIAVGLVILNHVGFSFFTGGFVGVDVFFVISGFLITSIIFPMIIENKFSFTWFLSRRIKRLMPVLLFVIFITIIVFSFVLLPRDLMLFYRSVIWVVLYVGNFFFWREHGGYFNGGSQEAPLLHTWSLAVEEQYYLLWPLMLLMAVKFLGAKVTAYLSLVVFVAATVFSQWGTEVTLGAAYYLLPTRFFELLMGSCLAIFWQKLPTISVKAQHLLSIIGLFLIIASALFLSEHSPFPGYNALYPVVGTALLIFSTTGVVNKFLSLKWMVFTGNISYSLYLWHWPVFVLVRYTAIEFTLPVQLFCIVFIYALSVLSYKFIEQPMRSMKLNSFAPIARTMYVIPAVVLIFIASSGVYFNGYKYRFSPEVVKMDEALNSFASKSRVGCHAAFRNSEQRPDDKCIFGLAEREQTASFFIIGDSHANHLLPLFQTLAAEGNLSGQDYTLDRCIPILDLNWGTNEFFAKKCRARNELAKQHIQSNNFDYVVLAASWPHYTSKRLYTEQQVFDESEKRALLKEKLSHTLQVIVEAGSVPLFVEDTPSLHGKSHKCPIKKEVFNNALDCSMTRVENIMLDGILDELKLKFPTLVVMHPHQLFCNDNQCVMALNGLPLYRDDNHLNEQGAKYLGKLYSQNYSNPLLNNLMTK